jgi:hypothetical protein
MNAPTSIKANLAIWNALGKTDPAHTKQFKRSGGFSGTALKPIWVERQLTEVFGPCGEGWGTDEPRFEMVTVGDEVLVYCTVRCWHTDPSKSLWGVGGDKVASKNKFGLQVDDEAFKKAHTDALMNAFKHIGVGADIHMGQFDDSKYVQEVAREFAAQGAGEGQRQGATVSPPQARPKNWGGRYPTMTALKQAMHTHHAELERMGIESVMDDLDGYLTSPEYLDYIAAASEHAPYYLEGERHPNAPPEFIQTFTLEQKARDMIALRGNVPADMETN